MRLEPIPREYVATREEVQRVATHVLARRRWELTGKFGLRATPGGIGTPAAGPDHETVRIAGTVLVRETTGAGAATTTVELASASLASAAAAVGVDLSCEFEAGGDTVPVGDPGAPLAIDAEAAHALAEWFRFGWTVLDAVIAELGPDASPSVIQLWPEHFDAGVDVAAAPGRRVGLGASPGDEYSREPYVYVGPFDARRPGDPGYWNAPFGAMVTYADLLGAHDPVARAVEFFLRGIAFVRADAGAPG